MDQVHPVGVVKPDDPEAFHGAGGLVRDADNVLPMFLERRTQRWQMWKNKLNRLDVHAVLMAKLSSCVVIAP